MIKNINSPSYLKLFKTGELKRRIKSANKLLSNCSLCPRFCNVNRYTEKGYCSSNIEPIISSYNPHFGEEPSITGIYGSGTIFFTNCTMKCIYCQNYPISQLKKGKKISIEELSDIMVSLQKKKCHNINFVTPTHFVPQILQALEIAVKKGLKIPLVYNTSGYESPITLKLLEDIIDIYLPDIKYANDTLAYKYSGVKNYVKFNQIAIKEMFRQTGFLQTDKSGIAKKGVIIRQLILPENIENSLNVLNFISREISNKISISLMAQYFPAYKALNDPKLNRKITKKEYDKVINYALKLKFENILIQELNE